jgi:hypothetical protein
MTIGDKVLALLGVKAACCGLLALAATGTLGGAFAWFMDRSIGWVVGAVLAVGIAAIIWRSGKIIGDGGCQRRSTKVP